MDTLTIVRDRQKKKPKEESPCQTSVDVAVLEVQVENIEDILKEHKKTTEKGFESLDKKIEKNLSELKENINKNFEEMKSALKKHEEKLEKVEEKVDGLKNNLTALIAKSGIVFSFLASLGMLGLNYLVEKIKG